MLILDDITTLLQVDLDAAVATSELHCYASYSDIQLTTGNLTNVASSSANTNGTTAINLVGAPVAGNSRKIQYVSVWNTDTVAAAVTVQVNENGTNKGLVKMTLQPGETLQFSDMEGWRKAELKKH